MTTVSLDELRKLQSRGNKFNARRVVCADGTFDSRDEYRCYQNLLIEQRCGTIKGLQHHAVKIQIAPSFKRGRRTYRARVFTPDFTYTRSGVFTVHEFKATPTMTTDFSLRWHIAQCLHLDWDFVITTKKDL
jgi:hypothetical protein